MSRSGKISLIALAGLLTLAPAASAQQRVVVVRRVLPFFVYGPGWYYPYPAYVPVAYTGNVKIKTHMKNAMVFVDGGYAGRAGKLKKFSLRPGNHTIALRDSDGRTFYQERIAVIPGKTIEIYA